MNKWDSNNLSLDELPRLKNLSRSDLDDGNKSVYDSIVNSERGVGTLSDGSLPNRRRKIFALEELNPGS